MLSVPGAKTVRGYSFFGDSFVYILFEDGTDPYWARSRVLEYLNQVQSRLPAQARTSLGPDATGVGWIYEYALVDRTGSMTSRSCARCRTGFSSTSSRPSRTCPRSPASAAWCSSTRSCSIPTSFAHITSRTRKSSRQYRRPIRRLVARCSSSPKLSTWCGLRIPRIPRGFPHIPLMTTDAGRPGPAWRCRARAGRARKCGAASRSSMAKVKLQVA